jgi:hypothetical protein
MELIGHAFMVAAAPDACGEVAVTGSGGQHQGEHRGWRQAEISW